MPSYTYQGLNKEGQEAIIASNMAPFASDYGPHPHLGGFPEKHDGNPPIYYPEDDDRGRALEAKQKRRDNYRKERLAEIKAKVKSMDACRVMAGIEFPKGEAVELQPGHALLHRKPYQVGSITKFRICKMAALVASGTFKEGRAAKVKESKSDDITKPVKTQKGA